MKPLAIRFDEDCLSKLKQYAKDEGLSDSAAIRRLVARGLEEASSANPIVEAIGQLRLDLFDQAERLDAINRRLDGNGAANTDDSRNLAECLAGIRMIVQRISVKPTAQPSAVAPRTEKVGAGRSEEPEPKGLFGWGRSGR